MAFRVSFYSALAAFLLALGQTLPIAATRALMVFGCMFLLSFLAAAALSRIAPAFLMMDAAASGPRPSGKGEDRVIDLEKQPVDLTKVQDMMR